MFFDKEFMGREVSERRLEILRNAFGKLFQNAEFVIKIKRDEIDAIPLTVLIGIVESIEKKIGRYDYFFVDKLFTFVNGAWVHGSIYFNGNEYHPIQLPITEVIHLLDKFEVIYLNEKI